jgi:hypothetical protein
VSRAGFWVLGLALAFTAPAGCLPVRETRQSGMEGVVLDRATLRPIARAILLVRAGSASGWRRGPAYRRYETDADGRLQVPEIRGWGLAGLDLRDLRGPDADDPGSSRAGIREHTYLAPGYAWIRLRVRVDPRPGPPRHVLMSPLPPDVPRLTLAGAAGRHWRSDATWEIAVPACGATAQGLREGGGVIVVSAPTLHAVREGLWLESPGEARGVRVVEGSRAREGRRVFLDARTCELRLEP